MSFIDEKQMAISPVEIYLDWKGKESDGYFSQYDKEELKNIKYKIGDCAIINIGFCVKGFNENLNSSIYSNKIGKWDEEVVVKSKGDILAQGVWKDIRDAVSGFGGNIHKVITMLDTKNGKIIEIYLKGQAGWGIVDKETKKNIWGGFTAIEAKLKRAMNIADSQYPTIKFKEAKLIEGKAFNYNIPEFELTNNFLKESEVITYLEAIKEFNEYRAELKANKTQKKQEVAEKADEPKSESFATNEDAENVFGGDEDLSDIPF